VIVVQFPATEMPAKVDAIVVLGAMDAYNMAEASRLVSAGVSDELVLSVPYGSLGTICKDPPRGLNVTCFVPDPSTTRGEAQEIHRLAESRGWTSIAVVTWTTHISRSRMLIERCFAGDLYMVDYADDMTFGDRLYEQVYQSASFVKAMVQPGC
jgi:hypothetical protein